MKKYIVGIMFVAVLFLSFGQLAEAACRSQNGDGGGMVALTTLDCFLNSSGNYIERKCGGGGWTATGGSGIDADGNGVCSPGRHTNVRFLISALRPYPISVIEPIASPVPKLHSSIPNQYIFSFFKLIDGILPTTDPVTVGHQSPLLDSSGNPIIGQDGNPIKGTEPVSIDSDGNVLAAFGNGLFSNAPFHPGTTSNNNNSNIAMWPPASIFDNVFSSFGTLDSTFQAFVSGTFNSNSGTFPSWIKPKWYPIMVSSLPDPVSKIPLVPVTINWKAVPGADSYHFKLSAVNNPLGISPWDINANIPATGIDIPSTTTRTYTFSGRGDVLYAWSATPLKLNTDGTYSEILGSEIMQNMVATFVQANVNDPQYNLHPDGYYTYGWNTIPGAVRYEIQYALSFGPMPESLPFAQTINGQPVTFSETTITQDNQPGSPTNTPVYILGGPNCSNCNLNTVYADYNTGFHQYDYTNSIFPGISNGTGLNYPSLHFRIRGIDSNGTVIREDITPSGMIQPPLPETPYQSGFPVWPRVTGATGYVVDVAENIADFDKLPKLTAAEVPSILVNKSVTTTTPATSSSTPFLLRRIVADGTYEAGKFAVDRFKTLLQQPRVYMGDVNEVSGYYADINDAMHQNPAYADYDAQTDFDALASAWNVDKSIDPNGLDTYYPTMFSTLGMNFVPSTTVSPVASNQIKFTSYTPVTIQNRSTGNALLTVVQTDNKLTVTPQNPYKMTTTLTFGVKNPAGGDGSYSFKIIGNFVYYNTSLDQSIHPLTFATIGPLPLLGNLTGKVATEFKELLPGTQYYYRVRGLKDLEPMMTPSPMNYSAPITFFPWSTPSSFVTPTGVPASITIGSDGTISEAPVQLSGIIPKIVVPVTPSVTSGGKSMTTTGVSQTLNWTSVTDAKNYNVNIYDKAGILFKSYTGITGTTLNVPGLNASSVYSLDLQAFNDLGKSAKSQLYSFNTPTIAAVNAISAANIKSYQNQVIAQKAVTAALKSYRAARVVANKTAKISVAKSMTALQAAIEYRRVDIQVSGTH